MKREQNKWSDKSKITKKELMDYLSKFQDDDVFVIDSETYYGSNTEAWILDDILTQDNDKDYYVIAKIEGVP